MTMLQKTLNRDLPYGRVAHGGAPDPEFSECHFYQHGLYFGHDGRLLENHKANADKVARIKALGRNEQEVREPEPEPLRQVGNPELIAQLEENSTEDLVEIAQNLMSTLKEQGIEDDFEPDPEDRNGLVNFIAKYAG